VGADCIREIGISIADPRIALTKGSHPAEQAFAFNAFLSRPGEMHLFPPKAVSGNVLNVLWERIVSAKSTAFGPRPFSVMFTFFRPKPLPAIFTDFGFEPFSVMYLMFCGSGLYPRNRYSQ
jgi:hypothetical protein